MANKMKGGVRLSDGFTNRNQALNFFLNNSTFSILTNSSISCITLLVTLNNGVNSPYKSVRSKDYDSNVRKILLKVFITADYSDWYTIEGRGPFGVPPNEMFGIEITSNHDFLNEISIQKDIYKKSFLSKVSLLEPMCPHIFNYLHCQPTDVQKFRSLNGLTPQEQIDLNNILDGGSQNNTKISIICMEFMDGYEMAKDIFTTTNADGKMVPANYDESILLDLLQFEFQRLNTYGYQHGDAHFGNVMIHRNYDYLRGGPKGRVLIIDFGRTVLNPVYNPGIVDNNLERFRNEPWGIAEEFLINITKFQNMYTEKQALEQDFHFQLGTYLRLESNNHTYDAIKGALENMIGSQPDIYNIGGAPRGIEKLTKMKPPFDLKYDIFKNNLIALFDDKANGELKGEVFRAKKQKQGGRKKRKQKGTRKKKSRKSITKKTRNIRKNTKNTRK